HPFWQAVTILVLAYVLIVFVIPLLPGSALVPKSVVLQYMATVLVGVLIYVSDSEGRWRRFQEPIRAMLIERRLKLVRGGVRVGVQPAAGELPGQRHHRAAHRELRVLADRQGRAGSAARGHALELGHARVGGFPQRARDLVGDPLPL